jgi:hypothetical protein
MIDDTIESFFIQIILNVVSQTKNKVLFRGYNLSTKVEQKK